MIKELRYSGYTANTSDYECADGDLDLSLGLVQENAHQEQLFEPQERIKLREGEEVIFIHKTSSYTHYISITRNGSYAWWFNEASKETEGNAKSIDTLRDGEQFVRATAIGNTLIIISNKAMYYYLWEYSENAEDSDYTLLGDHLPEIPISFGLQGKMEVSNPFNVTLTGQNYNLSEVHRTQTLEDADKISATNTILGQVNSFIANKATKRNKFIFPFFVRYALRLYDGSLVMHSAPILMRTYSAIPVRCVSSNPSMVSPRIAGIVHDLDLAVLTGELSNIQTNWKDIVSSVDIFVSAPIYSYDQNGKVGRFGYADALNVESLDDYSLCRRSDDEDLGNNADDGVYMYRKFNDWYNDWYYANFPNSTISSPYSTLYELPKRSEDKFFGDITDCSTFYFLKSIPLQDLTTTRTKIEIPEKHLENLLVQEVMTDDYDSHDRLIPNYTYIYNNKLHLADLEKELFSGFHPQSMFPYATEELNNIRYLDIYYYLKIDGKEFVVKRTNPSSFLPGEMIREDLRLSYLYYPSIYAYKAVIVIKEGRAISGEEIEIRKKTVFLKQHPFLNGAYFFDGSFGWIGATPLADDNTAIPSVSDSKIVNIESKIYSSEINNPFFFPLLGINTVGVGKIKALASATQALSQGQFGQFPLYAFTTGGVWALEISATGGFSKVHPISRDVILSQNSICQIDTGVLFATNRGIILLAGSETICISDDIDNKTSTNVASLPKLDILNNNKFPPESLAIEPFKNFLPDCRMIYDYVNSRIIVFNRGKRYSYVYSLESKKWGMNLSHLHSAVPSYPSALAINMNPNAEWTLVDVSQPKEETTQAKALLVTRPFKLDLPNDLKTIQTVIQRGVFKKNQIKQILYASNDLFNWYIVSSSSTSEIRGFSGTPYKYFRIALFCNFAKGDSLYGCTIEYEPRMMNRLR